MSIWLTCSGIIEMEVFHNQEEPTLGETFSFKDLLDEEFIIDKENSVPFGSEGSLTIFQNERILNEEFNKDIIFTITGSIRDVNNKEDMDIWLNKIVSKYKDIIDYLSIEILISAFLGNECKRFRYTFEDEEIVCKEIT